MTLKCAIQLDIHDIIHHHGLPMLLFELVEALNINQERTPFVYRLMRLLVHSSFFFKQSVSCDDEEGEGYLLAPASRLLLMDEPLSVKPFLLVVLDPILVDLWQHMSKWFQNNDVTPFHTTHARMLWDLGMESIMDVGGGTGTFAVAIAKAFPNIRCISFDLPHVVNGLVGSKNLSYVGGDMFEAIPKAGAVLLKTESLETQLLCDMLMMSLVTGREMSEID
ncbi:putative O-methyltransferase domain, plant methyltransferase dimerization [Helianthus annuus]|nr:putative O-methyltransferase domain, plant methyltransferase dimerization [Helianthus annuus]